MSSVPVVDAQIVDASARQHRRGLRARDVVMLVPALALGVLLLAVHQADRTGSPLSQIFSPSALAALVPAAFDDPGQPSR